MKRIVTFEQAILLRKLEFKEPCFYNYDLFGNFCPNVCLQDDERITTNELLECHNDDDLRTDAPTLSHVQKWLREEKDIDIDINVDYNNDIRTYISTAYNLTKGRNFFYHGDKFDSYEESLSDAITEILKLIDNE